MEIVETVRRLKEDYDILPATFPADVALVGWCEDALLAAEAALHMVNAGYGAQAYSQLRTVFEAGQRVLYLATDDNYLESGIKAFVFDLRKEAGLVAYTQPGDSPASPDTVLTQRLEDAGRAWEHLTGRDQRASFTEAVNALQEQQRQRKPDNFAGLNFALALETRYQKAAAKLGGTAAKGTSDINRTVYAFLSRETHSRIRIEPRAVRVVGGVVDVKPKAVDHESIADMIHTGLGGSLGDIEIGLRYRHAVRQIEQLIELEEKLHSRPPRPDYLPDFGISVMLSGNPPERLVFPGIRLTDLHIASKELITINCPILFSDTPYLLTVDVTRTALKQLLGALRAPDFAVVQEVMETNAPKTVTLSTEVHIVVTGRLGRVQHTRDDAFVPVLALQVVRD